MLTNRLTAAHQLPACCYLHARPPRGGPSLTAADRRIQSKSTTTVSSQLGRSLAGVIPARLGQETGRPASQAASLSFLPSPSCSMSASRSIRRPRCGNSIANQLTSSADRLASSPALPRLPSPLRTLIETGHTPWLRVRIGDLRRGLVSLQAQVMRSQCRRPIAYLPAARPGAPSRHQPHACVCPELLTASVGCGRRQRGLIGEES